MNDDVKEKWVKALRSGEYEAGRQALRTNSERYCCLGVLCDLATQEFEGAEWEPNTTRYVFVHGDSADEGYLPETTQEWAGIDAEGSGISVEGQPYTTLADLNDGAGYSFDDIATIIEEQL